MATILTPGYARWDGTKWVLDADIEIVGPEGDAGPTGPTGAQGTPGIGVGAAASGDLSGTFPTPISVVGMTGVSGVVSFGSSVTNPIITQTTAGTTSGQTMTLKAQDGSVNGGNVALQSGTGTTTGIIQFLSGSTIVGQFTSTKFITGIGRRIKVSNITSGPYTVQATDQVVSVGTLSAILTVNLPTGPVAGDTYTIKDANGSAASFNITVQGNGANIDAASSSVISSNYGVLRVVYNGSKWISI